MTMRSAGMMSNVEDDRNKSSGNTAVYAGTLAFVCIAVARTFPFPFLPWMVQIFKIDGDYVTADEAGYYVGLIASMQFAGLTVGSYFWGFLSDKFGRRPTLLASVFGVTGFCALFGFTNTNLGLPWAIFCRFMTGAFNGGVVIIRSIVSDVSKDNTNQAKGMTMINCAFQLGMVLGPAIGGTLAQPVRQYPSSFSKGGFFDKFPFFLPCIVATGVCAIIGTVVAVTLPETRVKRSHNLIVSKDEQSLSSAPNHDLEGVKLLRVSYNRSADEVLIGDDADYNYERHVDADNHFSSKISSVDSTNRGSGQHTMAMEGSSGGVWRSVRRFVRRMKVRATSSTAAELLKLSDVRWVLLLYCTYCFGVLGFSEMSNVWFATKPHKGGLGLSELQIGILTASAAVTLVPLMLFTIPKIEHKVGPLKAFYFGSIILVFTSMMFPVLASITNTIFLWTLLIASQLLFRVFIANCFVMIAIFINNSVDASKVGAINGISVAMSGIARSISPIITGSLYAWSIDYGPKHDRFPLDYHLAFYLLALAFFLSLCVSVKIPEYMTRMKTT